MKKRHLLLGTGSASSLICAVCGGAGDVPYVYDAYGNLTSEGEKTYAYAVNRLISVSDGASTTTYTYNGDGDRMSQALDSVTTKRLCTRKS